MSQVTPLRAADAAFDLSRCLEEVRRGDSDAARALVAHVRPILLRTIRRHLPRRDAAEDLLQDVYIKMFSRLDQYHGGAPFTHWLAKIALRTCYDRLRSQRCRPELRHADLQVEEVQQLTDAIDPGGQPISDTLVGRDLLQLLLAGLNPADRRVITWFYLEQKNTTDISGLTGWTIPFVKMRIFRARRKLQRALAGLRGWDRPAGLLPPKRTTRRSRRPRTVVEVLQARAA